MDNKMTSIDNLNILNDNNTKDISFDISNDSKLQEIDLTKDLGLEVLDLDNINKASPTPNLVVHNKGDSLNNLDTVTLPIDNINSLDITNLNNNTNLNNSNSNLNNSNSNLNNINLSNNNNSNTNGGIDLGLDLLANQNKKKTSDPNLLSNIGNNSNLNLDSNTIKQNSSSLNIGSNSNLNNTINLTKSPLQSSIPNISHTNTNTNANTNTNTHTNTNTNTNTNANANANTDDNITDNKNEPKPINQMTPEEIMKEKSEILSYFERIERRGHRIKTRFNLSSNLQDMRHEKQRAIDEREAENSVKFQRKMMMAFVTGVEFLNNRYDPFDVKLDGWSESVHENINDYDEVFEELYEKYKEKAQIAPELKLMLMMGGSAFMFHLTNSIFKSSIPGMNDIMQQNPELMKQFANAAMSQMSQDNPGFTNLMSDVNPNLQQFQQPPPNMMQQPPPNMMQQQPHPNMMQQSPPHNEPPRRDMSGPKGVDEILSQLHNNSLNSNQLNISDSEINDINSLDNVRNIELLDSKKTKQSTNSITLDL
jgi:hypothetical protein